MKNTKEQKIKFGKKIAVVLSLCLLILVGAIPASAVHAGNTEEVVSSSISSEEEVSSSSINASSLPLGESSTIDEESSASSSIESESSIEDSSVISSSDISDEEKVVTRAVSPNEFLLTAAAPEYIYKNIVFDFSVMGTNNSAETLKNSRVSLTNLKIHRTGGSVQEVKPETLYYTSNAAEIAPGESHNFDAHKVLVTEQLANDYGAAYNSLSKIEFTYTWEGYVDGQDEPLQMTTQITVKYSGYSYKEMFEPSLLHINPANKEVTVRLGAFSDVSTSITRNTVKLNKNKVYLVHADGTKEKIEIPAYTATFPKMGNSKYVATYHGFILPENIVPSDSIELSYTATLYSSDWSTSTENTQITQVLTIPLAELEFVQIDLSHLATTADAAPGKDIKVSFNLNNWGSAEATNAKIECTSISVMRNDVLVMTLDPSGSAVDIGIIQKQQSIPYSHTVNLPKTVQRGDKIVLKYKATAQILGEEVFSEDTVVVRVNKADLEGVVGTSKIATQVMQGTEQNKFKVELDVDAGEFKYTREKINIALVIDMSNSMNEADMIVNGKRTSRVEAARVAAIEFVNMLEATPDLEFRFSLSLFNGNGWVAAGFAETSDAILEVLNSPGFINMVGDSTNISDGLFYAEKTFQAINSVADHNIMVLISDGEPVAHHVTVKLEPATQEHKNNRYGYDYIATESDPYTSLDGSSLPIKEKVIATDGKTVTFDSVMATESHAYSLKQEGYEIYTIGIHGVAIADMLRNMASSDEKAVTSGADLGTAFEEIANQITTKPIKDGVVADPMSDYVDLFIEYGVGKTLEDGRTYTVDDLTAIDGLRDVLDFNVGTVKTSIVGGKWHLEWQVGTMDMNTNAKLSYYVGLKDEYQDGKSYDANGRTTLDYINANQENVLTDFPIPQISLGLKINFTKVDSVSDAVLSGVEFGWYKWMGVTQPTGTDQMVTAASVTGDKWEKAETLVSGTNGNVALPFKDEGIYQLTEEKAAAGYFLPDVQWRFEVDAAGAITDPKTMVASDSINIVNFVNKGTAAAPEWVLPNHKTEDWSFLKLKKDTGAPMSGAEFKLYLWTGETAPAKNILVTNDTIGTNADADKWMLFETSSSDANGMVDWKMANNSGYYQLVETKTEAGYELPLGQWRITIDNAKNELNIIAVKSDDGAMPPAFKVNATGVHELLNYKVGTLPKSGVVNNSIAALTIIAVVVITTGIILMTISQRKKMLSKAMVDAPADGYAAVDIYDSPVEVRADGRRCIRVVDMDELLKK